MSVRTGNIATLLIVAVGLALAAAAADADDAATAAAAAPAAPAKPLDLRPPDIRKLYTNQQLTAMLEKIDREHIEGVEVEGARVPRSTFTPRVWPGIAAPFWALFHPTQAWRIFAPLPPDQTRDAGPEVPYTDSYQLEPAGVPPDPFKQ